jgi:hypothetical protein
MVVKTIVEQTLEQLDSIFNEEELDRQERRDQGRQVRKLNKTKIKKAVKKGKRTRRRTDTLEKRAKEQAQKEVKKDVMGISNIKDASKESISKKQRIEKKMERDQYQRRIDRIARQRLRDMKKKESDRKL